MVAGHLQIKKGRYYAVITYTDNLGKQRKKWISLKLTEKGNKRKAEAELVRIRSEFVPPIFVESEDGLIETELSPDMLYADYLLKWLEIVRTRISVATYSSYRSLITSSIEPYFRAKGYKLSELQAHHIQSFYSKKLDEVKPNTVIHYHAIIHQSLKYAVKTDLLTKNVADKVDRPRKNSFTPVFLSEAELQQLFGIVKGTRYELPVLVAAFYGFRRGEVLGLKWDAIDFERGTISVKRTVTSINVDGKTVDYEQETAKTKSSLRTLPLVGAFKEYFMQARQAQEYNKQICGNSYNYEHDGYVFVDEMGTRMKSYTLSNKFPEFVERHGLRRIRFHDLRHSCASLLLANGVPLKQIQEWLGHSDFSTTANLYVHLDYASKVSSAAAMEKGLSLPESVKSGGKWSEAFSDE